MRVAWFCRGSVRGGCVVRVCSSGSRGGVSPQAIQELDSLLEGISREIWNLPLAFPKAGLHALLEDLGLNIPLIWEDYCGAAIRSWTQILNDEGALGTTAKASLQTA